jgi:hypothetical protein
MKRPQWSTASSTRASVSVENLFDEDNAQPEEADSEEHAAPNTSEFDGGLEDRLSEESSRPMNVDQDDSDAEVETRVFIKDEHNIQFD